VRLCPSGKKGNASKKRDLCNAPKENEKKKLTCNKSQEGGGHEEKKEKKGGLPRFLVKKKGEGLRFDPREKKRLSSVGYKSENERSSVSIWGGGKGAAYNTGTRKKER